MDDTKPTALAFRDPLLKVLGELTSLTPGVEVDTDTALAAVYEDTGIAEDDHGTVEGDRPYVRVIAVRAFNRMLKREGLAESPRRGIWSLTEKGAHVASLLTGPLAIDDHGESDPGEVPFELPAKTSTAEVPAAAHGGGAGVSWTLGPQVNSYSTDPYIRGLAIKTTPCFGKLSERSNLCKTCPISGACKAKVLGAVSDIAAELRQRDDAAIRKALEPPPPPEAEPLDKPADDDDDDQSIDDIIDLINKDPDDEGGEDSLPFHTMVDVPTGAKCEVCHQDLPRKSKAAWVRGVGMMHPDCFKKKHGISGT